MLTLFWTKLFDNPSVMDVRIENAGHPHHKTRWPAAALMGRIFSTPGYPGARVRDVFKGFGPKNLCLC